MKTSYVLSRGIVRLLACCGFGKLRRLRVVSKARSVVDQRVGRVKVLWGSHGGSGTLNSGRRELFAQGPPHEFVAARRRAWYGPMP